MRKDTWYKDGWMNGEEAALVNIDDSAEELRTAFKEDDLGRIVQEVRDHQVQMAGDISYDVGQRGGPTECQYSRWEEGFTDGFFAAVKAFVGL